MRDPSRRRCLNAPARLECLHGVPHFRPQDNLRHATKGRARTRWPRLRLLLGRETAESVFAGRRPHHSGRRRRLPRDGELGCGLSVMQQKKVVVQPWGRRRSPATLVRRQSGGQGYDDGDEIPEARPEDSLPPDVMAISLSSSSGPSSFRPVWPSRRPFSGPLSNP